MSLTPSWDLFIILFFVVTVAYGFILQRERCVMTLLATYVAIVVTLAIAGSAQQFFAGDKTILNQVWIRSNASPFTIQAAIFIVTIIILTARSGLKNSGTGRGIITPIEIFGFSFLNAGLILATLFSFLPVSDQISFANASKLASLIIKYQTWWIVLPVILMIITGFKRLRGGAVPPPQ
jgi:hypothetical protein